MMKASSETAAGETVSVAEAHQFLAEARTRVDACLESLVPAESIAPRAIHAAMRWSLFAGGKRLRPALVLATGAAFGARAESLTRAACAFELVHTYSLIHDDLPAMDDDDLRRGRPTCHVKFGEATAILAGDALQALAFQVIAEDEHLAAPVRVRLIAELARAAGHPPGWSPVSPTIWPRSRAPMSPPPNSIPSTGTKQARSSWRRRAPGR
jgi:geranylgeranyl pyrophosphate synthase